MQNEQMLFSINCAQKAAEEFGLESKQFLDKLEYLHAYDPVEIYKNATLDALKSIFEPAIIEGEKEQEKEPEKVGEAETITLDLGGYKKLLEELKLLDRYKEEWSKLGNEALTI